MGIDRFIFRPPHPSYTQSVVNDGYSQKYSSLQWIPSEDGQIPVMVMGYQDLKGRSNDNYLLYFHGNAEDLGMAERFLNILKEKLHVNIIAMEYSGYGIYNSKKPTAIQIKNDALAVYDYLVQKQGIPEKNIIVFGRSIGSGCACEISCNREPGKVILLSPFTSIKKLSGEIAFSLISYFVKERFDNITNVSKFKSPCLLIHGKADTLIKPEHSEILFAQMTQSGVKADLELRDNMTHNSFNIMTDVITPVKKFFCKFGHQKKVLPWNLHPQIFLNYFSNDKCVEQIKLITVQDKKEEEPPKVPVQKPRYQPDSERCLSSEFFRPIFNNQSYRKPFKTSKIAQKIIQSECLEDIKISPKKESLEISNS